MIDILLVEDHTIVREGIRSLLASDPELNISGEAESGQKAHDLLDEGISAQIILSDIHMPKLNGLELMAKLKSRKHAAKLIIMTMLDSEKYDRDI